MDQVSDCPSPMGPGGTAPAIWARWGLLQSDGLGGDCPTDMGQVGTAPLIWARWGLPH